MQMGCSSYGFRNGYSACISGNFPLRFLRKRYIPRFGMTNGEAVAGASGGTGVITYVWSDALTTNGMTLTAGIGTVL